MMSITAEEISEGWGHIHDVIYDALYSNKDEVGSLLDACEEQGNAIAVANSLINHIFSELTKNLIATWGFSDTPTRDNMWDDVSEKPNEVLAILKKYST